MGSYIGSSVYNDSPVTEQEVKDLINENGKGVFFAIHGETTFSDVLAEYNKGKIIICKYDPETPGEQTEWYFTLVRFNTETFDFVGVMKDGTIHRTGLNVNDGWENVTIFIPEEIFIGTYNVTSYADILAAYNSNKFILIKYDIPNTNYTIFVPLTFKGNTPFYFELIDRRITNQKIQMSIDTSNIWDFSVSNIVTVDAALDPTSHNPVENMAIAAELTAINNKITGDLNDIFLALASKGVTVPAGAGLDDVAGLIDTVPTGAPEPIINPNITTCLYIQKISGGSAVGVFSTFNVDDTIEFTLSPNIDIKGADYAGSYGGIANVIHFYPSTFIQICYNYGTIVFSTNDGYSNNAAIGDLLQGELYTFKMKKDKIILNGVEIPFNAFSSNVPYFQYPDISNNSPIIKFYEIKFFDSAGVPYKRYVPAKNSNNDIGMYECYEGNFYGNNGGSIELGPEMPL